MLNAFCQGHTVNVAIQLLQLNSKSHASKRPRILPSEEDRKFLLYCKSVQDTKNGGMICPIRYNVLCFAIAIAIPFETNHSSFLQSFLDSYMYNVTLEILQMDENHSSLQDIKVKYEIVFCGLDSAFVNGLMWHRKIMSRNILLV